MGYQSLHPQSANPFKCDAKPTHTSQSSQSCAKRCQSITNLMSIQCCPSASHMPIHCKPDVKSVPIHQSLIKTPNSEQIQRKSWSNTAPILAQSPNTAPHRSSITHCTHLPAGSALIGSASTQAMLIEFRDQLVTNLGTSVLWGPIEVSQRRTIQAIKFWSHANPSDYPQPIHQSIGNPRPIWIWIWLTKSDGHPERGGQPKKCFVVPSSTKRIQHKKEGTT